MNKHFFKVSWDWFSLVICPMIFLGAMFISGELIGFYTYQSSAGQTPEDLYFKYGIIGGGVACLFSFIRTVAMRYKINAHE